jgi:glutamate-5-semialdehyde dehydrogenase
MLLEMGQSAREASRQMAHADTETKNRVLTVLAVLMDQSRDAILTANRLDIEAAHAEGMAASLVDRLTLTGKRLEGLAFDLRRVAELPDPVGEQFEEKVLPNGLKLWKRRVPLGVMGVIYESRPNVTIDIAGLSIKTGNAAILRGGKESAQTNGILADISRKALIQCGLPADALQFISDPDRGLVLELLQLHEYVDIIIPRGGEPLHRFCRENSQIPVITGGIGICHIFVDDSANLNKALAVIHNAKTQRPSVCNALDTLLVHQGIAEHFLPRVVDYLSPAGVTFRADESAVRCLKVSGSANHRTLPQVVLPAGPNDFDTEWMSLVLGLKVVDGIDEAITHTNAHSMGHSDSILTEDDAHAARWINEVDSAAVYVNASTRFTDGGQFGLGAEVAISTQRLHARGPMGLRELTTYKWVAKGTYQVRE